MSCSRFLSFIFCCIFAMFPLKIHALVDYSEPSSTAGEVVSAPIPNTVQSNIKAKTRPNTKSGPKFLTFATRFDSISVDTQQASGKANVFHVNAQLQTLYNIFAELSYWGANSSDTEVSEDTSVQQGNPGIKLGFNWLRLGGGEGAANIDLYGGAIMKSSDSTFASSRNDTLFGVMTSKKIEHFILALEGEFRLTGSPKNSEDMHIGNIRKLMAGIGWIVSNDIRISAEAAAYKISKSDKDVESRLEADLSFSVLTPKLYLRVLPAVEIEMGAHFRTRRAKSNQNLLATKLIDIPGVYGNSIFAGLNIAI